MGEPEHLYESIDAALIEAFVRDGREEDLHLDFKLAAPDMTRDDRKNLAKALSGFGNADGGVVVWGVATEAPAAQGPNRASGVQPVAPLSRLLSRLIEFTPAGANPSVNGVENRVVRVGDDSGFAVTLVPASDAGPHMAKLGEDRYYKRSGGSFLRMEHYEVADMFGRRARPALELTHKIVPAGVIGDPNRPAGYSVWVILGFRNSGRGSAAAPFLDVLVNEPYRLFKYGVPASGSNPLMQHIEPEHANSGQFAGRADFVVHPRMQYDVARVAVDIAVRDRPFPPDLVIKYALAAEGFPLALNELTYPARELLRAAYPPS